VTGTEHGDLKHRIEKLGQLPTLPQVVQRIVSMIDRPETSAEDLGRLIEKDQVLSAKVLQLANSPFYGFPARIASVSHAVVVLGLNVVKGLALGASVFDMMRAAGMDQLWRHSLGVAMTAHILATRVGHKNPEELFVAGLLHDLGKVVVYVKLPETASRIAQAVRERDLYMLEAEQEILGLTHAEVAGWLATAWHLPTVLKEPIMYHHHPHLATGAPMQTTIVHVADVLVKAMGCGFSGDALVPALSAEAWKALNLDDEGLAACVAQAAQEFETIDDYL
jgi:HD-like signal output (HDOD) protein